MSGIRLRHPTLRSGQDSTVTYVVELPQVYPVPYECMTCSRPNQPYVHNNKAIHLRLDSEGCVIVAVDIFAALQTAFLGGMELVNEVQSPPALKVGAVDKAKERIIEMPLNVAQTPPAKLTPEANKYQAEARIWKPFVPVMDGIREKFDRIETKKVAEKRRIFTPTKGK